MAVVAVLTFVVTYTPGVPCDQLIQWRFFFHSLLRPDGKSVAKGKLKKEKTNNADTSDQ